jgi:hypothetical protein
MITSAACWGLWKLRNCLCAESHVVASMLESPCAIEDGGRLRKCMFGTGETDSAAGGNRMASSISRCYTWWWPGRKTSCCPMSQFQRDLCATGHHSDDAHNRKHWPMNQLTSPMLSCMAISKNMCSASSRLGLWTNPCLTQCALCPSPYMVQSLCAVRCLNWLTVHPVGLLEDPLYQSDYKTQVI